MPSPLLLIGAGRMGGALLRGWIENGLSSIAVVEPQPTPALRALARKHGLTLVTSVEALAAAKFAACVVAMKPQILKVQAASLAPVAQAGTLMVSIAAGTSIAAMRRAWGKGARIIRAMPNTPGAIGHGISALFAGPDATAKDRKLAERLLAALGETLWVPKEGMIDAVTAVSGSGPAYVFLLVEAMEDAGVAVGLPHDAARRLARAMVAGSGALLDSDRRPPAELRRDVTSPGGTTQAALDVLMAPDGLPQLMTRAVAAANARAKELADGG